MANSFNVSDATLIRELLETWANATRLGQKDAILANHTPDVTVFDVLPPMKYAGAAAYRQSWDAWWPTTAGPGIFAMQELTITAGSDVAFAHCVIHCGGTQPDGEMFEDWTRATFGLRKLEGRWLVTHQHISMPIEYTTAEKGNVYAYRTLSVFSWQLRRGD